MMHAPCPSSRRGLIVVILGPWGVSWSRARASLITQPNDTSYSRITRCWWTQIYDRTCYDNRKPRNPLLFHCLPYVHVHVRILRKTNLILLVYRLIKFERFVLESHVRMPIIFFIDHMIMADIYYRRAAKPAVPLPILIAAECIVFVSFTPNLDDDVNNQRPPCKTVSPLCCRSADTYRRVRVIIGTNVFVRRANVGLMDGRMDGQTEGFLSARSAVDKAADRKVEIRTCTQNIF